MGYTVHIILIALAVWYVWPEPEVYSLVGKTALVTGASQGLGVEIARGLASEGVSKLAICARRVAKVKETKDLLISEFPGLTVAAFACDVANAASRTALRDDLLADFGHLDILVNNAGVEKIYPFEQDTSESIDQQMNINCLGSIHLTHQFLPQMIARKTGAVVMMSSGAGKVPLAYGSVYSANRFCTKGFAEALRNEMRHRKTGVSIHSILPGRVHILLEPISAN
jgi:short-subunit dehydrogenase